MPTTLKEDNLSIGGSSPIAGYEQKQRRRMLVALALLLVALIVVLIRDHEFWLSSNSHPESAAAEQVVPPAVAPVTPQIAGPLSGSPVNASPTPAHPAVRSKARRLRARPPAEIAVPAPPDAQASAGPVITETNRTVLPPLEVEVVAGNKHRPVPTGNPSVKVDMQSSPSAGLGEAAPPESVQKGGISGSTPAAQVSLSPGVSARVSRSVEPNYPMLAKQMKVQGAVVLQALIDKGGNIEDLRVVSGPAILATAAQQAVKQWRFKPYYQQGQAVETEARITVNFTISTY